MVINYLKNENDIINKESIILMRIRNSSLLKALNENVINDNHQIIFELDNEKDIDEILDKISSTNCKVIIGLRALRCLSFKSLSDYSRLIVGFKERIDDNLLEIFKMFQKNYYFYDKKGFVVDSQSIIKSLK